MDDQRVMSLARQLNLAHAAHRDAEAKEKALDAQQMMAREELKTAKTNIGRLETALAKAIKGEEG